jgi:hypothetical protein
MPLEEGCGKKARSDNIRELMEKYKSSGTIGNTTPKSTKHAQAIAAAIAYSKQRKGKKK